MREGETSMRLATRVTTQCPQCGAQFDVTMAQLQLRKGFVRCVRCAHIFDGYANVVPAAKTHASPSVDAPVELAREPATQHTAAAPHPAVIRQRHSITFDDDAAPNVSTFSISDPAPTQIEDEPVWHLTDALPAAPPTPAIPATAAGDRPALSNAAPLPDFLQDSAPRRWTVWLWGALCLIAFAGIIAQAAVIYRVPLASHFPATRPALEYWCRVWGCEVSYPRAIRHITILASALRMQPQDKPADHRLMLHLTLRNQAARAQQWPSLRLDLTDFSGAVVIRKHLAPADYLPADLASRPFDARSEWALRLPLRAESANIQGYQITPFFP